MMLGSSPIVAMFRSFIVGAAVRVVLGSTGEGNNFVFLQRFGLGIPSPNITFHTEVLVCPRAGFSHEDQKTLDDKVAGMKDFAEVDLSWWSIKTASCVELGYGGAFCSEECCGVPHGAQQTGYPLNARLSVITNADVNTKRVYIYGTGAFDGNTAYHYTCDKKCWSNWAGTDYNPITNNCNTFTSAVLNMVYGLSEKKPHLGISDLITVHGRCPSTSSAIEGAAAELKPEYVESSSDSADPVSDIDTEDNFVFLQRFGLGIPSLNLTFHTEVLVCPRAGFSQEDQKTLDGKIAGLTDFTEIDLSWWSSKTAKCVELGYGGAPCVKECCGVPHGTRQTSYPLNARLSVIGNADVNTKRLYIYGTGSFDGNTAYHYTCDHKCWSNWGGIDYNPITNNCNTFTSTVLSMVYGLSQKKPHLGISDLITVHGHCPGSASASEGVVAVLKSHSAEERIMVV